MMKIAQNLLLIKKENHIMEQYVPGFEMLPIQNIVKGHLVISQHTHEKLCPQVIDDLSLRITETIDAFLKKNFKDKR
jgi:hypothetical protein